MTAFSGAAYCRGIGAPTTPSDGGKSTEHGRDDADRRWTLALQIVGASAGIAAWIAVVGGARWWARLTAIDVPAAQTVSSLPRGLLIAEGLRTLLVPLLLGGAIAVLMYLSRARGGEGDSGSEADDPKVIAGNTRAVAEEHAAWAVKMLDAAADAVEQANELAENLPDEGTERTIADRQAKLRAKVAECTNRLRLARKACQRAAESAASAVSAAADARLPSTRLSGAHGALEKARKSVEGARKTLGKVATKLDEADGQPIEAVERTKIRKDVRAVAKRLPDAKAEAEHAHAEVRAGDSPVRRDSIKKLRYMFLALAPVAFVRRGVQKTSDTYGAGAAIVLVVLPIAVFSAIALVLIHPDWWPPVIVAAAIVAALLILLFGTRRRDLALLVAAVATPVVMLVGFVTALSPAWIFVAGAASALIAWLALGAMDHWSGAGAMAWTLFVAIAVWSGALAFIGELGSGVTKLDGVAVYQKAPVDPVAGLYLGRTPQSVFLASTNDCNDPGCRRVMVIPVSKVTCAVFGPATTVHDDGRVTVSDGAPEATNAVPTDLEAFDQNTNEVCTGPPPPPTPGKTSPAGDYTDASTHELSLLDGLRLVIGGQAPRPGPGGRVVLASVLFGFGKHDLTADARANIAVAAREIKDAGAARVFVAGHADEKGSEDGNVRLSNQRAHAVATALRGSLPASVKIIPRGYGERLVLACNRDKKGADDREGRALNRRVEIRTRRLMTWEERGCGS